LRCLDALKTASCVSNLGMKEKYEGSLIAYVMEDVHQECETTGVEINLR